MEAKLAVIVLQGRVELVRPMNPAAIDDHHDLFAGCAELGHHVTSTIKWPILRHILAMSSVTLPIGLQSWTHTFANELQERPPLVY